MKEQKVLTVFVLLADLVLILLLMPVAQASYGNNSTVVVSASKENRVVSFNLSNGIDSRPIYGFVITIYAHGHFSEITETPSGWSTGRHGYHAVLWTTKNYPIEPGSAEDNFAIEVTQIGTYTIGWSVTDNTLQPVAWGTITIKVS